MSDVFPTTGRGYGAETDFNFPSSWPTTSLVAELVDSKDFLNGKGVFIVRLVGGTKFSTMPIPKNHSGVRASLDSRRPAHAKDEEFISFVGDPQIDVALRAISDRLCLLVEDKGFPVISTNELRRFATQAAEELIARVQWSEAVGDRLDTHQVRSLLGVSRQALSKRQRHGSLLGLPGAQTTWYPSWQFDIPAAAIRPVVREILTQFRETLDASPDPNVVASWANTPQREDLHGATPAEWIRAGKSDEGVIESARRAAAGLAL